MFLYPRSKGRSSHLGPFPLEVLPRDDDVAAREAARPARAADEPSFAQDPLGCAAHHYRELLAQFVDGAVARGQAPVPDEFSRRVVDIKGAAYFLGASQVGICSIPETAWRQGATRPAHEFAAVIVVEGPRLVSRNAVIGPRNHRW